MLKATQWTGLHVLKAVPATVAVLEFILRIGRLLSMVVQFIVDPKRKYSHTSAIAIDTFTAIGAQLNCVNIELSENLTDKFLPAELSKGRQTLVDLRD